MGNFITNDKNKNLQERLKELICISDEIKILVGFFHFSVLDVFYEELIKDPNKIIKVLVGIEYDDLTFYTSQYRRNATQIINHYLQKIKQKAKDDIYDNQITQKIVEFMLEKIENGTLIIRKTSTPNHAKLYIFKPNNIYQKALDGAFITGSSNFTFPGICLQNEFNVEIKDYGLDEANQYFDNLWKTSIQITENEQLKNQIIEIFKESSPLAKISPYEAYLKILKVYLDSISKDDHAQLIKEILVNAKYQPYNFQIDAISHALNILQNYNGVLIADVVGLGKTITACIVARRVIRNFVSVINN